MGMPVGNHLSITSLSLLRRRIVLVTAVVFAVALTALTARDLLPSANANGEERTISFFNIHNKETITITYSDFRKVGKFHVPHRASSFMQALGSMEFVFEDCRANFDVPAGILEKGSVLKEPAKAVEGRRGTSCGRLAQAEALSASVTVASQRSQLAVRGPAFPHDTASAVMPTPSVPMLSA